MKKQILKLGKELKKQSLKTINGGQMVYCVSNKTWYNIGVPGPGLPEDCHTPPGGEDTSDPCTPVWQGIPGGPGQWGCI
ncbi:hypothetical protein [Tenacibaculum sp. 190524A02b]|uniref:Uncharacterized protein n=1 Tax=Tenacibaculum vairaonense TaxID=3137860 RepID=A0ABM9PK38_9FLAO